MHHQPAGVQGEGWGGWERVRVRIEGWRLGLWRAGTGRTTESGWGARWAGQWPTRRGVDEGWELPGGIWMEHARDRAAVVHIWAVSEERLSN